GFLPWLTATAFLHSIIIQERRGMMKVWNVCLVITTFLLTMFGTFMTRSGIVQSVHAFGQDTTLAWLFSTFIGAIAVFSFGYVIYRLPLLRSRNELDSWLSREYAFLLNNWILLGAALFILTATLFPTLSEWIAHDRITVGPPFFNTTMTALVLGIFTPLRGWSEWTVRGAHLKFPLTASVMCFSLCAFVITTISQEFYRGTRVRQSHTKLDFFTSLIGLVARGKRRYGGYLVHVAIVLMFVGFAGDAYKVEKDFILDKGQQVQVGSTKYTLRYTGVNTSTAPDKDTLAATIEVQKDGKPYVTMYPAKWSFRHHEDEPPTTDVAIHKTLAEDLYIVLNGYDSKSQSVSIKTVINPLVNWIWLGFLLLIFGTVIAFLPDRALALAGAAAKSDKTKAAAAATAILFLLMSPATVHAQSQMAQVQQGSMLHMARNDHERMLFNKYRCLCGTCAHSLDECAADGCGEGEMRR